MSEKRFVQLGDTSIKDTLTGEEWYAPCETSLLELLNEQQELIEELQVSDEMGWKRAERFEKKCPKELHNKKMYIKRLEYKVQKFKEENEQLRQQLKEKEEDERLYANEILELRETNKEHIKFKSLGGNY